MIVSRHYHIGIVLYLVPKIMNVTLKQLQKNISILVVM